jgi:thioredoxin 1
LYSIEVVAVATTVQPDDHEDQAIRRGQVTGKLPDVTDGTFQSEVLESEQPVLVDFWAPWCGPCRVVHPTLEEIAVEREDVRIVSINVDDNQQTAARFDVLSIPTLILFRNGAEAKRVIGAMPKRRLEAELEPALAA